MEDRQRRPVVAEVAEDPTTTGSRDDRDILLLVGMLFVEKIFSPIRDELQFVITKAFFIITCHARDALRDVHVAIENARRPSVVRRLPERLLALCCSRRPSRPSSPPLLEICFSIIEISTEPVVNKLYTLLLVWFAQFYAPGLTAWLS